MLGIDVSKAELVCALRDQTSRAVLWDKVVPNTEEGIAQLLAKTKEGIPWVVEPTGNYSLRVVRQAVQAGRPVLLAPPRKAKAFLASLQSRAKTDKLDGRGLSLFALSQNLAPYPIKEASLDTIDQLLSARKGIVGCLTRLRLQQSALPEASECLCGAIADLQVRQKALDKQIAELSKTVPAMTAAKALQSVPGIGPVTAAAVTSRLSAKSFSHPDKFVAYVGLDVSISESGKRKGQRGLTHQGDAELRRLLYLAAQSNLRCKSSPLKEQYERERVKGLSSTAALCAVARKLANLCWSLHKYQSSYDPARVSQQGGQRQPLAASPVSKISQGAREPGSQGAREPANKENMLTP